MGGTGAPWMPQQVAAKLLASHHVGQDHPGSPELRSGHCFWRVCSCLSRLLEVAQRPWLVAPSSVSCGSPPPTSACAAPAPSGPAPPVPRRRDSPGYPITSRSCILNSATPAKSRSLRKAPVRTSAALGHRGRDVAPVMAPPEPPEAMATGSVAAAAEAEPRGGGGVRGVLRRTGRETDRHRTVRRSPWGPQCLTRCPLARPPAPRHAQEGRPVPVS